MDKGVKLTLDEVKAFGVRADVFSYHGKGKSKVKIFGNYVLFCTSWYRDGRKYTKEHSKMPTEAIFKRIERLYDKNGIVIAQRLNKRSELLTTGKGTCCRKAPVSAQEIYTQLEAHLP